MKIFPFLFLVVFLTVSNTPLRGAEPGVVKRAPAGSRWEISYDRKNSDPSELYDPLPLKTTVIRSSPNTLYERTVTVSGAVIERWRLGDFEVFFLPGENAAFLEGTGMRRFIHLSNYSRTDFEGFEWVSSANQKSVDENSAGEFIATHQADAAPSTETPDSSTDSYVPPTPVAVAMKAWINQRNRLPVRLEIGDQTRTYKFLEFERPPMPPAEVERLIRLDLATPEPVRRLSP